VKKSASALVLLLLFSVIVITSSQIEIVNAEGTIYIRSDGSVEGTDKIQRDGNVYTFTDNIFNSIVVEKDDVVIDGAGYSLQGDGSGYGIHLIHRSYVTLRNLEIEEFDTGIRFYGGSNNTINKNNILNNEWGIYVEYSKNNTLSENNITANEVGIRLTLSSNNVLRNNRMNNNRYNFGVSGANFVEYVNDIDTSNTVDEKPVYYLVNEQEKTAPLDAGHVVLVNCTGITVKNLNLTNNAEGILLAFTNNSTITQNTITNNGAGIELRGSSRNNSISGNYIANNEGNGVNLDSSENNLLGNTITNNGNYGVLLYFSSYNTIYGNNLTANELGIYFYGSSYNNVSSNSVINNSGVGFWFFGSSHNKIIRNNITDNQRSMYFEMQAFDNTIYHNNVVNNALQVFADTDSVNVWDNGVEGNYWSRYNGTDGDGNGIGDTPYILDENNQDNYPLMELYTIPENPPLLPLPYAPFDLFPEPDSIDVPLDTNISISISRPPSIVNMSISPEVAVKERIDEVIFYSGRYTFILSELLKPNTTYTVTIIFGDYGAPEGFAPTNTKTWNFTTVAEAGIVFPIVEVTLVASVIVVAFVILYYIRRKLKL
jgi:parallel beta-helix repeat protein